MKPWDLSIPNVYLLYYTNKAEMKPLIWCDTLCPQAKVTGRGLDFLRFVRVFRQNRNHSDQVEHESLLGHGLLPGLPWALNDPPLHDARVFPTRGDEVAVFTEEVDVGDVAAVSTVDVAGSPELRAGVGEEVNFAKVIAC